MQQSETTTDLVFFEVSQQRFALPAAAVVEVLYLLEPTAVPGWPPHALGLIDVRGSLIPLLDVSETLGLSPKPYAASQYILLVEAFGRPFGIVVDSVEGVRTMELPPESQFPSEEFLGVPTACRGTVEADGRVMLVDPDALVRALRVPERSGKATVGNPP